MCRYVEWKNRCRILQHVPQHVPQRSQNRTRETARPVQEWGIEVFTRQNQWDQPLERHLPQHLTSPRHHVTTSPRRANVSNKCVPTEIGTSKHFETLRNTSSDVTEAAIKSQSKERSSISLLCVLSTWNCCILGILGWDVQLDSQVPKRHGCNGSRAQFDKQDGLDLDSLDSLDKHLSETDL